MGRWWTAGIAAIGVAFGIASNVHAQSRTDDPATKSVPTGASPQQGTESTGCPMAAAPNLDHAIDSAMRAIDTNHDGSISREEAVSAGDAVVGALFFRADSNHDGVVTPEEARAFRAALTKEHPLLASLGSDLKAVGAGRFRDLMTLADVTNVRPVDMAEAHRIVQSSVSDLYAAADKNRDGELSQGELGEAVSAVSMKAFFHAADVNGDGRLSEAEFEQAILGPARSFLVMIDTNREQLRTTSEPAPSTPTQPPAPNTPLRPQGAQPADELPMPSR